MSGLIDAILSANAQAWAALSVMVVALFWCGVILLQVRNRIVRNSRIAPWKIYGPILVACGFFLALTGLLAVDLFFWDP